MPAENPTTPRVRDGLVQALEEELRASAAGTHSHSFSDTFSQTQTPAAHVVPKSQ